MRILIVDDSEDARVLLETALTAKGHTVETAANGKQGLEMAGRSRPDLIISDILMPEMDGFALCQAVKGDEKLGTVPFVFLTAAYITTKDKELAAALGAERFIVKTGDTGELLETVEEILKKYKGGRTKVPSQPTMDREELDRMHKEALIRQLDKKVQELEKEREALEELNKRYQDLYDNAPDMFVSVDAETAKIIRCNQTLATALGYSKKETIGRPIFFVYHPDCMEDAKKAFNSFVKTGEVRDALLQLKRKDGSKIDVSLNVSAVRDEKGKVLYSRSVWRDMTEQRRAEQSLLESEKKFHIISATAQEAIIMADDGGRVLYWNEAAERIFGYTKDEAAPKKLHELIIPARFHKEHLKGMKTFQETGKGDLIGKRMVELAALRKDGTEFPIEISLSGAMLEDRWVAVGMIRDITNRKRAEERVRKALEATIQAFVRTVESRDPYTAGHQQRVADIACAIAGEMGLSSELIDAISLGGRIHDVGKIGVPAEILTKPGRISAAEFEIIKTHPQVGYEILKDIEFTGPVLEIVHQHQERMDGSGYPQGLSGKEIHIVARIVAVADTVEAMASHRPYRAALGIDKALEEINEKKGSFYDSNVVDACIKLFREKGFKLE